MDRCAGQPVVMVTRPINISSCCSQQTSRRSPSQVTDACNIWMSRYSLRILGSFLRKLPEGCQSCFQLQGRSSRSLRQELCPQGPAVRHRRYRTTAVAAEEVKLVPSFLPEASVSRLVASIVHRRWLEWIASVCLSVVFRLMGRLVYGVKPWHCHYTGCTVMPAGLDR